MIKLLRLLNLRRLSAHPVRVILSIVAVGTGTALLGAVLVLYSSVQTSLSDIAKQLSNSGSAITVSGPTLHGGIAPDDLARVRAIDGVAGVLPVVRAFSIVNLDSGKRVQTYVVGFECGAASQIGALQCPDQLVGGSGADRVYVSGPLRRQLRTGTSLITDDGLVDISRGIPVKLGSGSQDSNLVIAPMPTVQRLFGRGGSVDLAYVTLANSASTRTVEQAIRTAAPNLVVASGTPAVENVSSPVLSLLAVLGMFMLGISGVLVYNSISLSVEERRRELAIQVVTGGTPLFTLVGIVGEGLVVGLAGGLLGCVASLLTSLPLVHGVDQQSRASVGVPIALHITALPILACIVMGAGSGFVASLIPGVRAFFSDPSSELKGERPVREGLPKRVATIAPILVLAALGCDFVTSRLAATGGIEGWQIIVGGVAMTFSTVFLDIAVAVSAASLLALVLRLRPRSGSLRLALANVTRSSQATGLMCVAVAAAVGVGTFSAGFLPAFRSKAAADVVEMNGGNVIVAPATESTRLEGLDVQDLHVPQAVVDHLADIPQVGSVRPIEFVRTRTADGGWVTLSQLAEPVPRVRMFQGSDPRAVIATGRVLIGPGVAREFHLKPGGRLVLQSPSGPVSVIVGAVWSDPSFGGRGVTLPESLLRTNWRAPATVVHVRAAPGVSNAELVRALSAELANTSLSVSDVADQKAEVADVLNSQLRPASQLQIGLIFLAFVVSLSTMLVIAARRTREVGVLGAIGVTRRQLFVSVLVEGAIVGIAGSLFGIAIGLHAFPSVADVGAIFLSVHAGFSWRPFAPVLYAALLTALLVVAACAPALRNISMRSDIALRYDQ